MIFADGLMSVHPERRDLSRVGKAIGTNHHSAPQQARIPWMPAGLECLRPDTRRNVALLQLKKGGVATIVFEVLEFVEVH